MLPLFVLMIADVGAVPAGAAAALASDLVLLFGSSIRHPAVAGRGTRDAMVRVRWSRTLGIPVAKQR